jgi:hypothetical protein
MEREFSLKLLNDASKKNSFLFFLNCNFIMEPIEKTVVEAPAASHIKSAITVESSVYTKAMSETTVTSSVEATATESVQEVTKADDIITNELEFLEEDDEAFAALMDEEEATAKRSDTELETTADPIESKAQTTKPEATETNKVESKAKTVDSEADDGIATTTATTKKSPSPSPMADEIYESTAYMEADDEEKENASALVSSQSPPPSANATNSTEKYPPRKTRAKSQEIHQKPTSPKKNTSERTKSASAKPTNNNNAGPKSSKDVETVSDNEEEESEAEYEVEKIEGHRIYKVCKILHSLIGSILLLIV